MTNVGLISDTHGLLRPEASEILKGSDHIIHAGDIDSPEVIQKLTDIAQVTAIRGNIDKGEWAAQFPEEEVVEINGRYIYILHDLNEIDLDPVAAGFHVVVSGHSHQPVIQEKDGILYINPGSAGPRRFSLPIALAKLEISAESIQAEIKEITS